MSSVRSVVFAASLAALVALVPGDAAAQGGILGRVKQKAAEKAGEKLGERGGRKPEAPAAGQPAAEPGAARSGAAAPSQPASETARNEYVLEISDANLDRLQAALDAEAREIQAIRPLLARTREDYDQCQMKLMTEDPKQKKLSEDMLAASEKGDTPGQQRILRQMGEYATEKCGENPDNTTYRMTLQGRPRAAGLAAGSFTSTQYDILKERIPPFCAAQTAGEEIVRLPGTGQNIHWVYTPSEVRALRPRCAALTKALAAVA